MADALQRQRNSIVPYSGPVRVRVSICVIQETLGLVAPTAMGLHRTEMLRLGSAVAVYVYTSHAAQHKTP